MKHHTIKLLLTLKAPKIKIVELANSADPDEVANNELPHLNLHCLPSSVRILAWMRIFFLKFCRRKFCRLLFGALRVKTDTCTTN